MGGERRSSCKLRGIVDERKRKKDEYPVRGGGEDDEEIRKADRNAWPALEPHPAAREGVTTVQKTTAAKEVDASSATPSAAPPYRLKCEPPRRRIAFLHFCTPLCSLVETQVVGLLNGRIDACFLANAS